MQQLLEVQESRASVPGGTLAYRLAGPAGAPVIVFETGWAASYVHGALLEVALADRFRMLRYDRAGVGRSTASRRPRAETFTEDLAALLDALAIEGPVVVSGQSFGGLMAALHAAQAPTMVRAVIQLDPTPELAEPSLDKVLGTTSTLIASIFSAQRAARRLGIGRPVIGADEIPAELARRMLLDTGTRESLRASKEHLALLPQIRDTIAREGYAAGVPRLLVRAGEVGEPSGVLARLTRKSAERSYETIGALLREQARRSGARFATVPTSHAGIVATRAGAAATAEIVEEFLGGLDRSGAV